MKKKPAELVYYEKQQKLFAEHMKKQQRGIKDTQHDTDVLE